jgi:hypothetical protein
VLIPVAVLVGAVLGAFGASRNRVRFRDERVLWMVGAAATATFFTWLAGSGALTFWALSSLGCAVLTPLLDARGTRAAWRTSALLKTVQCPLSTLAGFLVALFRRSAVRTLGGAWLAEAGEGRWAVALGAFVLAQRGILGATGRWPEPIVLHESYHTRNAACLGESGFYLAYLTLGAGRAMLCGAPWNGLGRDGRGNPFERTAYAIEREPREPPVAARGDKSA